MLSEVFFLHTVFLNLTKCFKLTDSFYKKINFIAINLYKTHNSKQKLSNELL